MVTIPVAEQVTEQEADVVQAADGPQFTILSPPEDGSEQPDEVDDLIGSVPQADSELPPAEVSPEFAAAAETEAAVGLNGGGAAASETPVAEAPAAPVPAPKPTREELYAEKLREAEQDYIEACMDRSRIESEISALKSALKEAHEEVGKTYDRLVHVRNKDPEQLELPYGDDSKPAAEPDAPPAAEAVTDVPPAESLDSETTDVDNSWRDVPITELNLEIKGFGKKKREALIEACPTIGAFEDLRAKAGPMGVHTELPDGFGEKIASELEERVIEWLEKWRRSQPEPQEAVVQPDPVPEDHETQVLTRARELDALAVKPDSAFGAIADDGAAAARNGEPITACNWTASDKQDSWLIGYLSVRGLGDAVEPGEAAEAGSGAEAGESGAA